MTPLDEHDLSGCTLCRLIEAVIEDRDDALWRGHVADAARFAEFIRRADRRTNQ